MFRGRGVKAEARKNKIAISYAGAPMMELLQYAVIGGRVALTAAS